MLTQSRSRLRHSVASASGLAALVYGGAAAVAAADVEATGAGGTAIGTGAVSRDCFRPGWSSYASVGVLMVQAVTTLLRSGRRLLRPFQPPILRGDVRKG